MGKHISMLLFVGLLSFCLPKNVWSQDGMAQYVTDELKNFQKDLEEMGKRIDTASNVEVYETEFKARRQLVESWYSINNEIIFSDKDLQSRYIQYTSLYERILKVINDKKAEKSKQEKMQKVNAKFNGYLQELTAYEELGNRYVANKRIDSLRIIKDKADDCLSMASMEYGKNQELVDDDEDLSMLWKNVKDSKTRISNMEVINTGIKIDMKTILMLVGILAGITLMITTISNKIKSAKLTKTPKKKEPKKKKDEGLPSI